MGVLRRIVSDFLKFNMFKFIHTADLHLDAPLKSLALKDQGLAEIVGNATRRALEQIVDLCIEEKVDALIIAGDLYDGDMRSMKTAAFLLSELERLNKSDISVFIIKGNHDAESVLTRELAFPPNVQVFSGHGECIKIPEKQTAIHGVSFAKPHAPDSLLSKFKSPEPGYFNVGLLHTSLSGSSQHDPYAPCSIADLESHGFDYWALGHIHVRTVHSNSPYIVMPGMPQGRDIGEQGSKSVTLVDFDGQSVTIEERHTSTVEFEQIEVSLSDVVEWRDALDVIKLAITNLVDERSQHKIIRIEIIGSTSLAWKIRRDFDLFYEQVSGIAQTIGSIWIDKIVNKLEPISMEIGSDDARSELINSMEGLLENSSFNLRAEQEVEELISELPPEIRSLFGEDESERSHAVKVFLEEGIKEISARMLSGERETSS